MLQEFPRAAITALIVWLRMRDGDNETSAGRAIAASPELRAINFYDPERISGRAVAAVLGARPDSIAWDAYLVYGPGVRWEAGPPAPDDWVHQLQGSRWTDPARHRTGEALLRALRAAVEAAA